MERPPEPPKKAPEQGDEATQMEASSPNTFKPNVPALRSSALEMQTAPAEDLRERERSPEAPPVLVLVPFVLRVLLRHQSNHHRSLPLKHSIQP